jgi:hypothetical protein
MGIPPHPAAYPDIVMYEQPLPISWRVLVRRDGVAIDLTDADILIPVFDDGIEVSELDLVGLNAANGEARLAINSDVFSAVKRYSTWRLFVPSIFNYPVLQGRLVKA